MVFRLPDRGYGEVRLLQELERLRYGSPLTLRDGVWELVHPRAPVDRMEYRFAADKDPFPDPGNPLQAQDGRSVVEFPDYGRPAWLAAPDPEPAVPVAEHARLRSPPGSDPAATLPLLVAHVGPDYEHAGQLTRLIAHAIAGGRLAPCRVALLDAPERDEACSASARYAQAYASDRAAAGHRGGLVGGLRGAPPPRRAGRRARRRAARLHVRARDHRAVRPAHAAPALPRHRPPGPRVLLPREWIKKVALMDGVYLLNNPFTFQAMEKHSAYCAMMRLGLKVPETWLIPHKQPPADERFAYTAAHYSLPSELEPIAERIGYALYMKPFDGGACVGVNRIRDAGELRARYDESGRRLMPLQAAVDGFDIFVRSLSIGGGDDGHALRPRPPASRPLPGLPRLLDARTGREVVTVGRTVNAFFRWGFNSYETLIRDGEVYPIDYANGPRRLADLPALLLSLGDVGAAQVVRVCCATGRPCTWR